MKKSLKQLNDLRNNPYKSDQERLEAQAEWDLRHKTMLKEQQKEQFEKGFCDESNSSRRADAAGVYVGRGVCELGGDVMSRHSCLSHGEVAFCDGCLIDALKYEIENLKTQAISDAAEIQSLKDQLNNMEQCYIEVKKERDDLQNPKPKTKWTTFKVTCLKCGHYLSGCHCDHFGDQCPHLNTTMFNEEGLAECFNCNSIIDENRNVVGGAP